MKDVEVPEHKRRRSLRASVADASFCAAMMGLGESYFIPLLLAMGASNFHVGVFSAAPQLFLAFSQFIGIALTERYRRRKRIVVSGVIAQTVFLAWFALEAARWTASPWLLIFLGIGHFGLNGIFAPAWHSLMGDLTTEADRGTYFGRRNGLMQLAMFGGLAAGGLILNHFAGIDRARVGFTIIMALAALSRLACVPALIAHFDVPYTAVRNATFTFWQFVRRSPRSNFAHFVYFTALMTFAMQMSAPYFTVYMLHDLKFSYLQYMVSQGTFIASQFLGMRFFGVFSDKFGNRLVLRVCGGFSPFLPLLWMLTTDFRFIVALQVVAGLAWGGWFLSTANFLFDAVTPPKRARCAAYLNFFNGLCFFFGAVTGAWLSMHAPHALHSTALHITFRSPLQSIFLASSGLRFIIVFLFLPLVHEVRAVQAPDLKNVYYVLKSVRPLAGVHFTPFTGFNIREHAHNVIGKIKKNGH